MAELLDHYDFLSKRPRPPKHAWDLWLNGEIWKISQGTDFQGKIDSFRCSVYRQAHARNGRARVCIKDDHLIIQFYKPTE